ncbi:MAG: hypothetical protein ACR2MT_16875 [Aurantibacter sp.]
MSLRHIIVTCILMCCFLYSTAQKSTELYIPIGKSPGLSGKYTAQGKVESVNLQDSTITIITEAASKTIKLKGHPEIMLDHSNHKQPNKRGSLTDIQIGVLVEVKYRHNKPGDSIEWIKCAMDN